VGRVEMAASGTATMKSTWRMPSPGTSLGQIWETAYPLKVYNSLTRSKVGAPARKRARSLACTAIAKFPTTASLTHRAPACRRRSCPFKGAVCCGTCADRRYTTRLTWGTRGEKEFAPVSPAPHRRAHRTNAPTPARARRTYICFDILRRVMADFFGYEVLLTMNITDIDDKIIMRSAAAGVPFEALAREQEASFLADMDKLGVAPPDAMTRVSEYVPEIVAFISRILTNGFGYASNGSVYFDTVAYAASPSHMYGKLVPENVGNTAAAEEGEGALGAGAGDKRAACDFALWKGSKPGEPFWPSPWGEGRPGWHIECSAMCGETLGLLGPGSGSIDIHSGGVDLRFPHHDNEIAQSEACYRSHQWTNYFIHSGHLNIEGLKMSKSLKNFIKIGDALERYGARQLRLAFLQQRYNAPMNYSERAMEEMAGVERTYTEFFASVKATLRGLPATVSQHWGAREIALSSALSRSKEVVRACLADDFDTPGAMAALSEVVRYTNVYMAGPGRPVPLALKACVDYVSSIFRVFGLIDAAPSVGFGAGVGGVADAAAAAASGAEGVSSREAVLAPYLDALASFRESVREAALAGDTGRVLAACDALRGDVLPPLGVKLEDAGAAGGGAKWKLRDPEEVLREMADKAAAAEEKARRKAEAADEAARKAAEKEAKAAIDPRLLFVGDALYSAWDGEGVPTHDAAGAELPKSTVKKLKREWGVQEKLHAWLKAKDTTHRDGIF
jgi:cysteinyl-tRNA synthetase